MREADDTRLKNFKCQARCEFLKWQLQVLVVIVKPCIIHERDQRKYVYMNITRIIGKDPTSTGPNMKQSTLSKAGFNSFMPRDLLDRCI